MEKILAKNSVRGEKMTNIRYGYERQQFIEQCLTWAPGDFPGGQMISGQDDFTEEYEI